MRCCDDYRELLAAVEAAKAKAGFDSGMARLLDYVYETVKESFEHHVETAGEASWYD